MKKVLILITFIIFANITSFGQIGGYALKFDGTDDYVNCGDIAATKITNNLTISVWVKPVTSSNYSWIDILTNHWMVNQSGIIIAINASTGQLHYAMHTNIGYIVRDPAAYLFDDKWHHVTITYASGTILTYLDGVLIDTYNSGTSTITYSGTYPVWIGRDSGYQGEFIKGLIDEVQIWSVVRTEAEIKSTMYKELSGSETGLVLYYDMNSTSGTTLNNKASGGSYSGTLMNGTAWVTSGCLAGPRNALDFDGINDLTGDYISFAASPVYDNSTLTIEAWIKSTSNFPEREIVSWGNTGTDAVVEFRMQEGKLQFGIDPKNNLSDWDAVIGSTNINTGNWTHVAVVKSGTSVKLYVNGIEDGSKTIVKVPTVNQFTIGTMRQKGVPFFSTWTNKYYYFPGQIDEVRIWNSVRTTAEIRESMMKTLLGNETGLVAYYRFDQYDGSILYDLTSNHYDGTLTNMDAATDWVSSNAFNTWIGGESTTWGTAANWSSGTIPGATDNVGLYKWVLGSEATISSSSTVNNLLFSSTSSPTLDNISVNGNLILEKNLDLNGKIITLGSIGYLSEGSYRLYGTSGTITTTRNLDILSNENIAGLGAVISSGRKTYTVTGAGSNIVDGVYEYYDIYNGKNRYKNGDFYIAYEFGMWSILDESLQYYYSSGSENEDPPTDGWEIFMGMEPVPTLTLGATQTMGNTTITRGHVSQTYSGTNSINRYYEINPANNVNLNAKLVFNYLNDELNGITENNLVLFKQTNPDVWVAQSSTLDAVNNTLTLEGISSFSKWTAADNSAFPVELTSLTASYTKNNVMLKWLTATEINNYGFEIQKSENGEEFTKIGFVEGHGNSNSTNVYTFIDNNVSPGNYFYRLKQLDNNGNFSVSERIAVEIPFLPKEFALYQNYPNPFNPVTKIKYSIPVEGLVNIAIFNMLGEKVMQLVNTNTKAGNYEIDFNGSTFSSGVYFYKIESGNFVNVKKMILMK